MVVSPCTSAMSGWADSSQPSMPSMSLAVSPARVWLGRMTSRSASTAKPKVSATWRNISLCWPVATTVQRKSLRAAQRGHHRRELDRLRAGAHEDQDVARCGQAVSDSRHLWLCVAGGRPRRRATISRPASQMNSLLVVR